MDPRLILAVTPVDVAGSMSRGNQLAAETNALRTNNALQDVYRTQGANLLQGDQGALNALAQIDPAQAFNMQGAFMQNRTTQRQFEILNAQEKRAIAEAASQMDERQRQQALQQAQQEVLRFVMAPDAATFDQMVTQAGKPELAGMFDQRQRLGAFYIDDFNKAIEMAVGGASGGADNQTERDIALLGEIGIPRNEAIRITQLYTVSRDPMTGEQVLIDKSTGRPVEPSQAMGQPTPQPTPQTSQQPISMGDAGQQFSFGQQYQNAPSVFGWEGLLKRAANTATDVIPGIGTAFPQEQQTFADFRVLRESLINDVASAYPRQPPSWLLQNIEALTPNPGTLWEGPDSAATKLRSLGASLNNELQLADRQLGSRIAPAQRQEILLRKSGLESALNRIQTALTELEGGSAPASNVAQEDLDLMNQLLGGN